MELPGFPWLGLKYEVLLDESLYLFFCSYFSDILSNIDKRTVELEFIIKQFGKNKLNLRIEFLDLQALQIFLLVLSDNIGVKGNHGLQKPW
jgi:hypothetical protein